ncbi:MAG: hypothetical protein R3F05_19275 [Planctomycetota bacterium]
MVRALPAKDYWSSAQDRFIASPVVYTGPDGTATLPSLWSGDDTRISVGFLKGYAQAEAVVVPPDQREPVEFKLVRE